MDLRMYKVSTPTGYYRENAGAAASFDATEEDATPVTKSWVEYLALCVSGPISAESQT